MDLQNFFKIALMIARTRKKTFNKIKIGGHRRCFRIKLVQMQISSHFETSLLP